MTTHPGRTFPVPHARPYGLASDSSRRAYDTRKYQTDMAGHFPCVICGRPVDTTKRTAVLVNMATAQFVASSDELHESSLTIEFIGPECEKKCRKVSP
jgi:hypothetical protein